MDVSHLSPSRLKERAPCSPSATARSPWCGLSTGLPGATVHGHLVETSHHGSGLVSCKCKGDLEAGAAEDATLPHPFLRVFKSFSF